MENERNKHVRNLRTCWGKCKLWQINGAFETHWICPHQLDNISTIVRLAKSRRKDIQLEIYKFSNWSEVIETLLVLPEVHSFQRFDELDGMDRSKYKWLKRDSTIMWIDKYFKARGQ